MDEIGKLILKGGAVVSQPQEIPLTGQEVVIGRDPGADLLIPSPLISRRHARVFARNGQYLIEDLASTNKTYLNGQLVDGPQPLNDGDRVQLGKVVHLVFVAAPRPDLTALDAAAAAGASAVDETLYEGDLAGGSGTLLAEDRPPAELAQPPSLVVSLADGEPRIIRLVDDRIRLGRAADNSVVTGSGNCFPLPGVQGNG